MQQDAALPFWSATSSYDFERELVTGTISLILSLEVTGPHAIY